MDQNRSSSLSSTGVQWNDTSSCKLELSFWRPDIDKDEVLPLISAVNPFDVYVGKTGPFAPGEKVFNYQEKFTIILKEQAATLEHYLGRYLSSVAKDRELDVQITMSLKEGYRTLRLFLNKDYPLGGLHLQEIDANDEIVKETAFDFGYIDAYTPDLDSVYVGEDQVLFPTRLHIFHKFLQEACKVYVGSVMLPALVSGATISGGSGRPANAPRNPAPRTAGSAGGGARSGLSRRPVGKPRKAPEEASSSPDKVFDE